jgi:protocatechuate 3,4-dioxygenase alpha subunit
MSSEEKLVPSGSQTVGPFFRIGLEFLMERTVLDEGVAERVEIGGRVIDRDGAPVPDALLEFWCSGNGGGGKQRRWLAAGICSRGNES